jgi:hypothetical protein
LKSEMANFKSRTAYPDPSGRLRQDKRVVRHEEASVKIPEPASDEILSWAEVNLTHRIQNGVYQRGGRLISLLTDFGRINPCYPDRQAESLDTIYYTGEGRRGDQTLSPGNRALFAAIESGHCVPLFNKLAVGRWQHMGFWRVRAGSHIFDEKENRMLWLFTLKRVASSQ